MTGTVLITGSAGLIGSALRPALRARGRPVRGLDLRGSDTEDERRGDVRAAADVAAAISGCSGVVHLAAVSRVVWAERDPQRCREVNVGGTRTVLEAARAMEPPPWVIFASSREVYGQPIALPATEDTRLRPLNAYGRSKVAAEALVEQARAAGLRACSLRLSNAYGSPHDHADRVIPAFVRAALSGRRLRVEGAERCFDFTHVDDVAAGLLATIERLEDGDSLPPIQLVSGKPTRLGELAELVLKLANHPWGARIGHAPARSYDVARFCGSAERAFALLHWQPQVALAEGLARLIAALRRPATITRLVEQRHPSGVPPKR